MVVIERLKQEELAEELVVRLRAEAREFGPLRMSQVIVQNAGLGRWLRLWQARRCGISAGLEMPFARGVISDELDACGLLDADALLSPERVRWWVFAILQQRAFEGWGHQAEPLKRYLRDDHPQFERRCWSLAGQLSNLFDQYSIYRPEWLETWMSGAEDKEEPLPHWFWQKRLFVAMLEAAGADPDDARRQIFGLALHAFCRGEGEVKTHAEPLHVFGLSSFPPAFLRFFDRLATSRPVVAYHLVCSEAFLGDLPRNYREALIEALEAKDPEVEMPPQVHNPFLVANGQAAARFQSLLLAEGYPIGDSPGLDAGNQRGDLFSLQKALRLDEPFVDFTGDGSISFHACHSRVREVQVLQQQLLALFAADPSLRPEEILVLAPEIADYTDAIESVFGAGSKVGEDARPVSIPFCIADRYSTGDENCWRFFEALLDLLGGRQLFTDVVALLDFEPVCQRLGVGRDDLQELMIILQDVGVRWGIDAESRAAQGQPAFAEYTWDYGLNRIYDGLAYPSEGTPDSAPYAVSSSNAETIGQLTQLLRPAFAFVRRMQRSIPLAEWISEVLQLLRGLLGDTGEAGEWLRTLSVILGDLAETAAAAPIRFATAALIMREARDEPAGPSGLLRRGVTFCRLQPVRHIPARVICILGMNEGEFPRQKRVPEFDMLEQHRRRAEQLRQSPLAYREHHYLGDHRIRDEDRQLFLDCLLNARERVLISYIGQSDKSNEAVPPSLLVNELLQLLRMSKHDANLEAADAALREEVLESIVVRHPLQEWGRENFVYRQPGAGDLPVPIHFDCRLATMREHTEAPRAFFDPADVELTEPADADFGSNRISTDVTELVRFLRDPAKAYLSNRLQVRLDQLEWSNEYEDWEAMETGPLQEWQLRSLALDRWLRSHGKINLEAFRVRLQRELVLPPGRAGVSAWNNVIKPVLDQLNARIGDLALQRRRSVFTCCGVEVAYEGWYLPDGRHVIFVNGEVAEAKYAVEAYARHLAGGAESVILSVKNGAFFQAETPPSPVSEHAEWFRIVVEHWIQGRDQPIPFSPLIAHDFVKRCLKEPAPEAIEGHLDTAYGRKWSGGFGQSGDDSEEQRLCFNGDSPAAPGSPFRDAFIVVAMGVMAPVEQWIGNLKSGGDHA